MNTEAKLARIASALRGAGLECLVMGGHAVRYYGVGRNTNDFDFYVSASSVEEVRDRLVKAELTGTVRPREGPSRRRGDFARFEIGRLADGREEWLEFWLHNHLLGDQALVTEAISDCRHPVPFAFLAPFVERAVPPPALVVEIDDAYLIPLRNVEPGSIKHVALVEVVRRSYKRWAMEVDRLDKELRSRRQI